MSKKLVIVALMAVLAIGASVAQATPSRLDTLGQNTGLVYIEDDTNIFFNPADLANYRNCLLFHMGGYGSSNDMLASGGVSLGLGEMLTLGIIVARNPSYEEGPLALFTRGDTVLDTGTSLPLMFLNNWADYNVGTNAIAFPVNVDTDGDTIADSTVPAAFNAAMNWQNPIDIILAAKLGSVNLGVSWYYANGKHTSSLTNDAPFDSDNEMTAKLMSWKFGVAATMGNLTPEVWFHYSPLKVTSTWNDNIAPTGSIERELKARNFNIGARVAVKLNDNLSLVPMFQYSNLKGDVTFDMTPDLIVGGLTIREDQLVETYTGSAIQAGIGINYAMERLLVASSIGMQWMSGRRELSVDGWAGSVTDEEKWMAIPVVGLGLEYQCTKILVFRGGIATTTVFTRDTEISSADVAGSLNYEDQSNITEQSTRASVGLGLNFGNLVIDLTAGEMLIAGEPAFNSLFSAMDFKYKF